MEVSLDKTRNLSLLLTESVAIYNRNKHFFSGDLINTNIWRFLMDRQTSQNFPRGPWTNEKHHHFLDTMEASFVRTMLENNAVHETHHSLRLDRYMPDSSESTLDLKSHRRNKRFTSSSGDISVGPTKRISVEGTLHSKLFHQDQVVPQLEDRSGDDHGNGGVTTSVASGTC